MSDPGPCVSVSAQRLGQGGTLRRTRHRAGSTPCGVPWTPRSVSTKHGSDRSCQPVPQWTPRAHPVYRPPVVITRGSRRGVSRWAQLLNLWPSFTTHIVTNGGKSVQRGSQIPRFNDKAQCSFSGLVPCMMLQLKLRDCEDSSTAAASADRTAARMALHPQGWRCSPTLRGWFCNPRL